MFDCVKQMSWMRMIFWEITNKDPRPKEERRFEANEVYTDTDAVFLIALNKQATAKIKHIPIKSHFIMNCIEGKIGLLVRFLASIVSHLL